MHLASNLIFRDKIVLLLFSFCLFFYLSAPVTQMADSNYSMMVSQSLIDHGTIRLDKYKIEKHEPFSKPGVVHTGYPYQIEVHQEKLYYHFPNGTSVLSAPFVALLNIFGLSAVNADGTYNLNGETKIQRILAALLMSMVAVLFYFTSRVSLNKTFSLAIALTGALATPLLSTASRAMWAHTWLVLLLSSIIFLVWRGIREKKKPNPILLATLVAWMYFVRPTSSISIIAVSALVLIYFRPIFIAYCLTGLGWLAGFLIYSQYQFDTFLPSYYTASRLGSETFFIALAGNAISPARGLLVYSPFIFSIVLALLVFRESVQEKSVVFVSVVAIVLHWLVVSSFPHWWGGHSYGPRFMTDVIPWILLLAIIALQAARTSSSDSNQSLSPFFIFRAHVAGAFLLVAISIFMHIPGAFSGHSAMWNSHPNNIDRNRERIWDWRYPQFLVGLLTPRISKDFPDFISGKPIYLNTPAAEPFLDYGWSGAEPNHRWTEKNNARFGFKATAGKPIAVTLKLIPFVVKGHDRQRLRIEANNEFVSEFVLGEQPLSEFRFVIPGTFVKATNIIALYIPDAISPKELKVSLDPRKLGIAVEYIAITEL